ncbi:nucleotidyltransferase family protein [Acidithiobacillus montserratensis]|uniref:Nucleotidyltransferase family protein n=1 Tax=Acidithiobacillus montserratensis TaxID=2729135 RepID=A0ACD5HEF7_9PROT|nr:nucleotidyltransferase family protein [Acidithiobacillus montserratensis]MBU2747972.1 NTP transferase domain-containing protein [Acidithiobacillus montserratensis]
MAVAVILAGGRSSRSGTLHKSCRKVPGDLRSWIDRQVDRLRYAGFAPVIVVTGLRPQRVHRCLHRRVSFRHHFKAVQGPFSTLQRAVKNIRNPLLIVQTDTVLPSVSDLQCLRRTMQNQTIAAASMVNDCGSGGHPLMLSGFMARNLQALLWENPDARLDKQLSYLPPEQYKRLNRKMDHSFPRLNTQREWCSSRIRARRLP